MDADSFKREIIPHYRRMFAVAVHILRDRDGAADVVQEAMTRLWEHRDQLDAVTSMQAYSITVTRRICLDHLRDEASYHKTPLNDGIFIADDTASSAVESRDDMRLLKELMSKLPQAQLRVLRLSAISGLSNDEIAQSTGESPANVRQLLSRARRKLKELFISANK